MSWLTWSLVSAAAAALTAILAKAAVAAVPSTTATAIRTIVVLVLAWALVFLQGEHKSLHALSMRSIGLLLLSGIATGVSWLAYFRALQLAPAAWVAPIDKLSLPFTILLALLVLKEPVTWQGALGVALMTVGALITLWR